MRAEKTRDEATSPEVARAATEQAALPRGEVALIGVITGPSRSRAILRTSDGRIHSLSTGARIAGARVAAIDAESVILERGGRARRIRLPSRP